MSGEIDISKSHGTIWQERHYNIEFDLIMIVNGRNLRFEARWQRDGKSVGGYKDISIEAAFELVTM